jgi:cobaltochelatase CobN
VILFLTNADTEVLALRCIAEGLPEGFPALRAANPGGLEGPPSLDGVDLVVVRLLGGADAWSGFEALREACVSRGIPLAAFGGEAVPDAALMARSTVPAGIVRDAFSYLVHGGLANLENLLRFLVDTVLLGGFGFEPPVPVPAVGVLGSPRRDPGRPTVGVLFYRAHLVAGNTTFVEDLCEALEQRGVNALPVYCYSLRGEDAPVVELLQELGVDAVVATVLAGGSYEGATGSAAEGWAPSALASLDVPVVQAVAATTSSDAWRSSAQGLSPLDATWSVALPEFEGRIVSVPFSFKEVVDDGEVGSPVLAYRTVRDRVARVAGLASRLARLRRTPPGERRVAIVLSAYPTRRSRLGNAVGLDTPASVLRLLEALRAAGYRVERVPPSGDALMAELARGLAYDRESLGPEELAGAVGRLAGAAYAERVFAALPAETRRALVGTWGEPPGAVHRDGDDLVFSGLELGNVLVAVQPPRGFGDSPIATYHSPDLPPTHHYLAFYRWLDEGFGADAVVHLGKHGTLEWLPGKSVGLSAACFPDAALGDLPLVYPFVVNDPGEGTQAKRRAHAVIVDHLVPPLTRAGTYDELARLERLLDEHATLAALDPSKLPALRREVWELLVDAEIHRDLGLEGRFGPGAVGFEDEAFDELVLEVDGYLCELKDAQIRGGLHVLGQPPEGEALVDLVLACTRLPQGDVPSLRARVAGELGVDLERASRRELDAVEESCRRELERLAAAGWRYDGEDPTLRFVADRLVPALEATTGEIDAVLSALDGRFVPPGPSGAPSRGMAHVLPTGRNFYSLDPKAVPSRHAWEVGQRLARGVVERHLAETGRYPSSVAIVVWGTAAMRTGGDDVAEALALLGVRPRWSAETGRVEGLEVVPLGELGRPRVDVTLRISGFFRDAFPHVVALFDEAVALVGGLDEPAGENPVRAHGLDDPRVFGPKPGGYGSGVLGLIESRSWRGEEDLAEVWLAWSGYSYRPGAMGEPAADALARRLVLADVALKNQDNREHDVFDSDDYLQDHGGMVAAIRALRAGRAPLALFGDSADPARPVVRSLAEEAARVVRTRVVNPKWLAAMRRHGYKGAFEMAATVDYLFGYDATAGVVEDWMYERVTAAYVGDPESRAFLERSNPDALRAIAERLLEAHQRGMWQASPESLETLRAAVLAGEALEEGR